MSLLDPRHKSVSAHACRFPTTHWSVVLAAGRHPTPHSQQALATLCEKYWYPLYAYIRRRGYGIEEAQDLTQEFFTRLLEKNYLREVKCERGRFRSFLLASLKNFLSNKRDRARAQKRGGGQVPIPLEFGTAESRYNLEPSDELTPEKVFERRWALTLLDRVLDRLRDEFFSAGKTKVYDHLKVFLTVENPRVPYNQVAAQLNMTEGAVKVAVHRLRRRFRDLLRAEIAQTLSNPDEIGEEIRYLLGVIGT